MGYSVTTMGTGNDTVYKGEEIGIGRGAAAGGTV